MTMEFLFSMVLKSTLILAAASLAAALFRRSSAATRHLIWAAALASLLLLPLLDGVAPSWSLKVPAALAQVPAQATTVLDVVAHRSGPEFSPAGLVGWIWLAGTMILLVRTAGGIVKVARLVRRTRAPGQLGENVRISRSVSMPVVCGFWRPSVLLPEQALSWPSDRLRMVLKHERMHIVRYDTRTYLMARLALAVYWPNPLVWWAANRMHREAERACDDGVLLQGEKPASYASELMEVVQALQGAGGLPEGGLAMGRVSELESRLKALLKSGLSRRRATPVLVTGVGVLSLVMLLPLAAVRAPAQQSGGGAITGVVRDANGAPVPKARVMVALADSQRKEFAIAGAAGQFTLQPLPEGSYSVTVEHEGFARLRLDGIVLKAGQATPVQPVLNIGQASETSDVTAERPATAPPAAAGGPQRLMVSGGVQATKLLQKIPPSYPSDCKAEGVDGTVLLRGVIGVDGAMINLQQVNQLVDARLVAASKEAVKQWRYQPTLLNGVPVEVVTEIQINFSLAQ
jgi:beta-lactamase regulating signal transducer with metallopeptidase domain